MFQKKPEAILGNEKGHTLFGYGPWIMTPRHGWIRARGKTDFTLTRKLTALAQLFSGYTQKAHSYLQLIRSEIQIGGVAGGQVVVMHYHRTPTPVLIRTRFFEKNLSCVIILFLWKPPPHPPVKPATRGTATGTQGDTEEIVPDRNNALQAW